MSGDLAKSLTVPEIEPVRYDRNFLKTVVCELRFPALLELETKPPAEFQRRLRREYPFYDKEQSVSVGGPEGLAREHRYAFRSKNRNWSILLKNYSLAIETTAYTDFEEFFSRLDWLVETSKKLIDSDFFTRVGLRYINSIPIGDGELSGWINSELVSCLTNGVFGPVDQYIMEVRGYTNVGHYTFRHGIKPRENARDEPPTDYLLDFDYFKENIEVTETLSLITEFNNINFSFFSWALGEKSRNYLGTGKPKGTQ